MYGLKAAQFLVHGSWAYTRGGFERHARERFHERDWASADLSGRHVLITGANSGIGYCAAESLSRLGACVHLLCRSEERGRDALTRLRQQLPAEADAASRLFLHQLDVSELHSVHRFAREYEAGGYPAPSVLVHNAGVMQQPRALTSEGVEVNFATNVLGPFALTELLLPRMATAPGGDARVIFVTSAGMLTECLEVDDLEYAQATPFDAMRQYSRNKRQQVALAEHYAAHASDKVLFLSCHPGWVDTPILRTSMPSFYQRTQSMLRTPEQGADTVVWLAAAPREQLVNGGFYFDRAPAKKHLPLSDTRYSMRDVERLYAQLQGYQRRLEPQVARASPPASLDAQN